MKKKMGAENEETFLCGHITYKVSVQSLTLLAEISSKVKALTLPENKTKNIVKGRNETKDGKNEKNERNNCGINNEETH